MEWDAIVKRSASVPRSNDDPALNLSTSYQTCERLARRTARNFYYAFLVLPRPQRQAMCALYAFLRRTDDLGDNRQPTEVRRAALEAWRTALTSALQGQFVDPLLPALADTVARYRILPEYLHRCIDGVLMDLDRQQYETFDELADYCYHVAGVVGLSCIQIWGHHGGEAAFEPARRCGIAFQLTNMLRDVQEDALVDRVYLPQADLRQFDVDPDAFRRGECDARMLELLRFQIARAERYYDEAAALGPWLSPAGQAVFGAMTDIYRGLLMEIKRDPSAVFRRRVSLSVVRKLGIAARWLLPWPSWVLRPRSAPVETTCPTK